MGMRTYQYVLKVLPKQERVFTRWAGCRRFVYNELLKTMLWPIRKLRMKERALTGTATTPYPSVYELQKRLSQLKALYPWLKQPPSHVLQQAVVDLMAGLSGVADGAGFPKLKRKGRCTDSFRENDPRLFTIDQHNSRIKISKLGWVRYRNSRTFEGTPKTLTLIREGARWVVSIQVEIADAPLDAHPNAHSAVGIDRGVAVFAALSDGSTIASVSPLKAALRKLRTAQRSLSRKKRGPNNWRRAQRNVQRIHRKVANIRHDFLHKASTYIAKNHGTVVLEKLAVANMVRSAAGTVDNPGHGVAAKRSLNRSILDQGWYRLQQMLSYKLQQRNGQLLFVNAAYSSQRCSICGHTAAENRRSQAVFCCVSCGHAENADHNAAKNILWAGQAQAGVGAGKPAAHQPQQRRARKPTRRSACALNGT